MHFSVALNAAQLIRNLADWLLIAHKIFCDFSELFLVKAQFAESLHATG